MNDDTKNIQLIKVDASNFDALIGLSPTEPQKNFVASNVYSLAEAYATMASGRCVQPFGIYCGDVPVGFLMIGYAYQDEEEDMPACLENSYLIWRLMIDQKYQGKGYGREAMRLALDYIRAFPFGEADCCWLSYEPENEAAKNLYSSFGFQEIEKPQSWDEVPAVLKL